MDKILNLDSVDQYNSLYGLETLNPLVSVIDLNKATRQMDYVHWNYGVYALYLKLEKACDIKYGRRSYDYQEGTVVCFAPGQTTETTLTTDRVQLNVLGILFHPDLLRGTTLGKTIKKPATAEAVSCPATAITGIAPRPVSFCISFVNTPTCSPG